MNVIRFGILLLCCGSALTHAERDILNITDTLASISAYAQRLPEHPHARIEAGKGWQHPDYSSFYMQQQPGFFSRLLTSIGFADRAWDPAILQNLLRSVTAMRSQKDTQPFVQAMRPSSHLKMIVLGALSGGFHSLVRDLIRLEELNIIDNDLKINAGYVVVINGEAINGSPFNMQTLIVLLLLMQKNPDQLIYVRGPAEDLAAWHQSNIYRQLDSYAVSIGQIKQELDAFFATLPRALYILQADQGFVVVPKLSASIETAMPLLPKEVQQADIPLEQVAAYEYASPLTFITSGITPNSQGLTKKEFKPLVWEVSSGQTAAHRAVYQFFYDAFVLIDSAPEFSKWTISLYHQNVRRRERFASVATYSLIDGILLRGKGLPVSHQELASLKGDVQQAEEQVRKLKEQCEDAQKPKSVSSVMVQEIDEEPALAGQHGNAIVFGCTLDLSKALKNQGRLLRQGMIAHLKEMNESGGVHTVPLQIVFLDDEYTPRIASNNIQTLLTQYRTDILVGATGTSTLLSYLQLIKKGQLLSLFPVTGASIFRSGQLYNVIHYRPSYAQELQTLTRYLIKEKRAHRFAIFYQDDEAGREAKDAIRATLHASGVSELKEVSFDRTVINFEKQAKELLAYDPDAIAFSSTSAVAQKLINQMGIEELLGKNLFGISYLAEGAFQQFLRQKGLFFYIANVVPNPQRSDIELVREFRKVAKVGNISLDPFALEGYLIVALTTYLLEQVTGILTKEKIIQAAQKIDTLNFKGIPLTFDPKSRALSDTLWISKGDGKAWYKEKVKPLDLLPDAFQEQKSDSAAQAVSEKAMSVQRDADGDDLDKQKDSMAVQDGIIVMGCTLDLTKGASTHAHALRRGIELGFDVLNEKGGVDGKKVRVVFVEDAYDPSRARANILYFLQTIKTNLIFSPVGSATLDNYRDLIAQEKILTLFPITGVDFFNKKELSHIINYRVSYVQEMYTLTKYAIARNEVRKVAIFYQEDSFGHSSAHGVKLALSKAGISNILEVPYDRNDLRLDQQVAQIRAFEPDMIAFCSTSIVTKGIIRQLGTGAFSGKTLLGVSDLSEHTFRTFLKNKGLRMLLANVVPNPTAQELPIVKEFNNLAKGTDVPLDTFALEGYINSKIFALLVSRIAGAINMDSIIQAAQNIKEVDLGGIALHFNPINRTFSNWVWVSDGTSSDWQKINVEPLSATELKIKPKGML